MKAPANMNGELCKKLLKLIPALALIGMCIQTAQAVTYPTSYWKFDDSANRGLDTAGGRNVGFPATTPDFDPGLIGDGMNNATATFKYAVDPATNSVFNLGSSDFTMQTWVNFASTAGEQVFIEKFTGPSGPGWTFYKLSSNAIEFYGGAGVGGVGTSPALTISTGAWHQFVARRSGTTFTLFYDGAAVGSTLGVGAAVTTSPNPLEISGRSSGGTLGGGKFVQGNMDEVAFWKIALSDSDISSLFNGGSGLALIPEPSSVALAGLGGLVLLRRRRS